MPVTPLELYFPPETEPFGPSLASVVVKHRHDMNIETNVLPSVQQEPTRSWLARTAGQALVTAGTWAGDTAQKFAALLADLMGPAVFVSYAMTAWSLTNDFGWSQSFLFTSGPMANWLIWLGISVLLSFAASILKRHTQSKI